MEFYFGPVKKHEAAAAQGKNPVVPGHSSSTVPPPLSPQDERLQREELRARIPKEWGPVQKATESSKRSGSHLGSTSKPVSPSKVSPHQGPEASPVPINRTVPSRAVPSRHDKCPTLIDVPSRAVFSLSTLTEYRRTKGCLAESLLCVLRDS